MLIVLLTIFNLCRLLTVIALAVNWSVISNSSKSQKVTYKSLKCKCDGKSYTRKKNQFEAPGEEKWLNSNRVYKSGHCSQPIRQHSNQMNLFLSELLVEKLITLIVAMLCPLFRTKSLTSKIRRRYWVKYMI